MSLGKFAFNLTTSVVLGPVKYGYKLIAEPEHRARNLTFLTASLVGLTVISDVVEAAIESGSDTAVGGLDSIETRNDHLLGTSHPETDVMFKEQTIHLTDEDLIGIFPVFESEFNVKIPESLYLSNDATQFAYANLSLSMNLDSDLIEDLGLSKEDIVALNNGSTPEGFVWHHGEQPGMLHLVNEEIHANTGHTGGREIWGGGSEYR